MLSGEIIPKLTTAVLLGILGITAALITHWLIRYRKRDVRVQTAINMTMRVIWIVLGVALVLAVVVFLLVRP